MYEYVTDATATYRRNFYIDQFSIITYIMYILEYINYFYVLGAMEKAKIFIFEVYVRFLFVKIYKLPLIWRTRCRKPSDIPPHFLDLF